MGKLTLILLTLLSWLQYSLWLGKNGIQDVLRIKNDIMIQYSNNAQLKDRNDHLLSEIDNLQNYQKTDEKNII